MEKPDSEATGNEVATIPSRLPAKISAAKLAPCLKVVLPNRKVVLVPVDKASSDGQRSILVAKARKFMDDQLEKLGNKTLTPQEIKDVIKAVADLDSLQREQFVAQLNNKPETALGHGLREMIRGAAKGAAEGTSQAFMEKMHLMDKAAKKVEQVINV